MQNPLPVRHCHPAARAGNLSAFALTITLLGLAAAPSYAQGAAPSAGKPETPELPGITVTADTLREERRVGSNRQPEWTTERRFAATRAYVLPPGMVELEQWWRGTYKRDRSEAHRFLTEVSVGLPGRWQLDLYGHLERESGSNTRYIGEQVEARYALANWGRIPTNPTLYLEWQNNHDGPQVLEGKLLLADEVRKGWHWAANFSFEEEMGGAREIERALTFAVSKTVKDSKFSVGVEGVLEYVTAHGSSSETGFLIGPSFQWRPTRTVHLDVVPLFGTTGDAPDSQIYVVLGVNLRQGEKGEDVEGPVSSRIR
jgi:hypothetical protein